MPRATRRRSRGAVPPLEGHAAAHPPAAVRAAPDGAPHRASWVPLAVLVALVGGAALLVWRLGYFDLRHPGDLAAAIDRARRTPWIGPIFVAVYAAIAAMALPVSPLALAAGVLFGFARGSLFVWIASLIGAGAGYWLAHGVGAKKARRLLGRYHGALSRLRSHRGFVTILSLQLFPVLPFGLLTYGAAIAGVRFLPFMAATALGILPGTLAYVYLADEILSGIAGAERRAFISAAVVGLLLVAISFAPRLVKKLARR